MAKTAMIRARTEPGLKHEAERIFYLLGLSPSEAINLFFRQVRLQQGLPFEVKLPNKTTLRAMEDVEAGRKLVRSKNARTVFKKLGI